MATTIWNWALHNPDRALALVGVLIAVIAVVIAVIAIADVRRLFRELEHRDKTTQERTRTAILHELNNYGASITAFFRASQYIEFNPMDLNRESAMLLFMTFRVQQLLAPNDSKAELAELQKITRKQVEDAAQGYAEMIIGAGLGTLKKGYQINAPQKPMPEIGPLPEPLNSSPVDFSKHWSILDQTKAEFKASGRSGVVIFVESDDSYRVKLTAFLEKFNTKFDMSKPGVKPYLVIEHATEAKALYDLVLSYGLKAELIHPGQ